MNTLFTKQRPEAPGKEIEVITVNYAPGPVGAVHRHDARAVVYVLEGRVEMQVRGGMLQRLGPGQVFYESPEDVHTVTRVKRNHRSSPYLLSKMKENRFSLPFTSFGREQYISPMKSFFLEQYSFRGGTY